MRVHSPVKHYPAQPLSVPGTWFGLTAGATEIALARAALQELMSPAARSATANEPICWRSQIPESWPREVEQE
jgi:hypothetical protein